MADSPKRSAGLTVLVRFGTSALLECPDDGLAVEGAPDAMPGGPVWTWGFDEPDFDYSRRSSASARRALGGRDRRVHGLRNHPRGAGR